MSHFLTCGLWVLLNLNKWHTPSIRFMGFYEICNIYKLMANFLTYDLWVFIKFAYINGCHTSLHTIYGLY